MPFFGKPIAIASFLVALLPASMGSAQENDALRALPPFILRQFVPGNSIEQIVAQILQPIRAYDVKGDGLDGNDVDTAEAFGKAAQRAQLVNDSLRYDLDGNFEVTVAEAQAAAERQLGVGNGRVAARVGEIMAPDQDKNGAISIQEMAQQEPSASQRRREEGLRELLRLDPDGDGRLQAAELEKLVRAAFATLDQNANGVLDRKELPVPLAQ